MTTTHPTHPMDDREPDEGLRALGGSLGGGDDDQPGCECEQDYNCVLHGSTSRPTWIESRYQGADASEEEGS